MRFILTQICPRCFLHVFCILLNFRICERTGVACATEDTDTGDTLSKKQLNDIYACLFDSMNDYTKDRRGDVGAWYV